MEGERDGVCVCVTASGRESRIGKDVNFEERKRERDTDTIRIKHILCVCVCVCV